MDLTHRFTVPVPVDEAWATFNDLEFAAPCFPGAALTSYDGTDFAGLVKVKLGPISLQYTGTGTFLERDETSHRAVIEAKGKDRRGNGTASARVTAQLTGTDARSTAVEVHTALNITGKPAQFGRGMIQEVGDKLIGQFVTCLETRLAEVPPTSSDESEAEVDPVKVAESATPKRSAAKKPSTAKKASTAKKSAAKKASTTAGAAEGAPAVATAAKQTQAESPAAKEAPAESSAAETTKRAESAESKHEVVATPTQQAAGEAAAAAATGQNGLGAHHPGDRGPSVATRSAAHHPARPPEPAAAALDLGRAVLPIMLKRWGPYLAGGLLVLVVGWRVLRRR